MAAQHKMGWHPSLPDIRDYHYQAPHNADPSLPAIDLRPNCPPVQDQGHLGSCTANAVEVALWFDLMKQGLPAGPLSRLFIYYNTRASEGTINSDSGATLRDTIQSVANWGAPPESDCPYLIEYFASPPSVNAYEDGEKTRAVSYFAVPQVLQLMKACLASGYPFVFGVTVYESFESAQVESTGVVPMPQPHEQVLGGHAMMCCGYNDAQNTFIVQNSWSDSWGDKGYCYMPYAYLTNSQLASDFWTVRMVS
jgi:C1A family cysteine protease